MEREGNEIKAAILSQDDTCEGNGPCRPKQALPASAARVAPRRHVGARARRLNSLRQFAHQHGATSNTATAAASSDATDKATAPQPSDGAFNARASTSASRTRRAQPRPAPRTTPPPSPAARPTLGWLPHGYQVITELDVSTPPPTAADASLRRTGHDAAHKAKRPRRAADASGRKRARLSKLKRELSTWRRG